MDPLTVAGAIGYLGASSAFQLGCLRTGGIAASIIRTTHDYLPTLLGGAC